MIGHLRGTAIAPDLVDVGGVGYLVTPTFPLAIGHEVSMFVHTVVREDALDLFGFDTVAARDLFQVLLRVPKVGPKVAATILATLGAPAVARIVTTGDHAALSKVRGVGPKLAQSICTSVTVPANVLEALVGDEPVTSTGDTGADPRVDALVGLGYPAAVAESALRAVDAEHGPDLPEDRALRLALRALAAA